MLIGLVKDDVRIVSHGLGCKVSIAYPSVRELKSFGSVLNLVPEEQDIVPGLIFCSLAPCKKAKNLYF